MDDSRLRAALCSLENLYRLRDDIQDDRWPQVLELVERNVKVLDEFSLFTGGYGIQIQTGTVSSIQKIAYDSPNTEQAAGIRSWCLETWLRLVNRHGEEVPVLQGIGQWWQLRAHEILSRMRTEGSSSDDGNEVERRFPHAATARHHSAGHVEARAMLFTAADYLQRAVDRARQINTIDGNLLTLAAEALINLGTVTHGRESRRHFERAIRYIRAASLFPNYELAEELQRFLDEYGSLIE